MRKVMSQVSFFTQPWCRRITPDKNSSELKGQLIVSLKICLHDNPKLFQSNLSRATFKAASIELHPICSTTNSLASFRNFAWIKFCHRRQVVSMPHNSLYVSSLKIRPSTTSIMGTFFIHYFHKTKCVLVSKSFLILRQQIKSWSPL